MKATLYQKQLAPQVVLPKPKALGLPKTALSAIPGGVVKVPRVEMTIRESSAPLSKSCDSRMGWA